MGGTNGLDRPHVGIPGNGDRRRKWFRLIDKVWSAKNLAGSLQKVVAKGGSAGIDNQSARAVYEYQEQTIRKLEQELRTGQYQPQAVKRVWIPKPGSQRSDRWGYRRSEIGSYKEQCSKSSNRSSSEIRGSKLWV